MTVNTTVVLVLVLVFGLNATFWSVVGLGRLIAAVSAKPRGRHSSERSDALTPDDVAVLIAAHNEQLVIGETIASAAALVPAANIFVISDGSTDRTAAVVRAAGANVLELSPNRGKAGALAAGIDHFELRRRFEAVMLLDADTRLAPDYLATGLAQLSSPGVVAVAGCSTTLTAPAPPTRLGRLLVTYRERVYVAVQYLIKYGQAARWANAVTIVPGFASMYRTRVLEHIDITAPGLAIEDFNMTFEVHAKRLGRIAFHPRAAVAQTQDPDNFRDYVSQVRRWSLGFWQTVRRHRFRMGRFWLALVAFIAELVASSVLLLLFVPVLVVSIVAHVVDYAGIATWEPLLAVPPHVLLLGFLVPDLLLTLLTAAVGRRPRFLLYALVFPALRIVDAAVCLRALLLAWKSHDSGVWRSPARRTAAPRTAVHEGGQVTTLVPGRPRLQIVGEDSAGPEQRHSESA